MTHVRAFTPGDIYSRSIDPLAFKSKAVNGCWPRPPARAPAPPPPPECARPRCDEPAVDDGHCAPHAAEEKEWRALDAAALRHATRVHPDGSPTPRHPEGSNDG